MRPKPLANCAGRKVSLIGRITASGCGWNAERRAKQLQHHHQSVWKHWRLPDRIMTMWRRRENRKIEQRVVFMKHGRECNICAAPTAVPVSTVHDEQVAPSEDLLGYLLAKMREDRRVSEISVAE
jgi:hypothetical protein